MALDNILWRDTADPAQLDAVYKPPLNERTILLKGWQLSSEHAPFRADTVWEKDVLITLRDGCKIRADIFRPNDDQKVPALITWSPYGKSACRNGGFNPLDMIPGRVGVPKNRLSGFEKFEAPDPAEWTANAYAVVNPDSRGVYDSEGDIYHFGRAEAKDGYDVVEAIAAMDWCNGSVGLVGNSWLGIAQWFIAAERPPHLKCIAPLEGASDFYREILCRGGIPQTPFWDFLSSLLRGRNRQEDVVGMLKKSTLMNNYWEDKRANINQINVPAYVLASYSTFLHTFGSFRGFTEIPHDKKWLRVHPTQEWHDLYQKSTNDELKQFFDHYTKGVANGWEQTPKVRASILRYDREPIINRPFQDWPVPETRERILYLTPNGELSSQPAAKPGTLEYKSDAPFLQMDSDREELTFAHIFGESCTLLGCARAILYMSTSDSSDMDVFVQIRKSSVTGQILQHINIPAADREICKMPSPVEPINPLIYLGPTGCLRASHRALDPQLTQPWWPEHDYTKSEPVKQGEVVKLEIGLWQTGIQFEKGEKLVLKVAGHNMVLAEFPDLRGRMPNENHGVHTVHVGGSFNSRLIIPTVDLS